MLLITLSILNLYEIYLVAVLAQPPYVSITYISLFYLFIYLFCFIYLFIFFFFFTYYFVLLFSSSRCPTWPVPKSRSVTYLVITQGLLPPPTTRRFGSAILRPSGKAVAAQAIFDVTLRQPFRKKSSKYGICIYSCIYLFFYLFL